MNENGFITSEQTTAIQVYMEKSGNSCLTSNLHVGAVTPSSLTEFISQVYNQKVYSIEDFAYEKTVQSIDRQDLVLRHEILPLEQTDTLVTLAISDPTNLEAQDDFRFATGRLIKPILVDHSQLMGAIRKLYGNAIAQQSSSASVSEDELAELAAIDESNESETALNDDAPVSRYIQRTLMDAVRKNASDIHFEPFEDSYQIRFRLDGILQLYSTPPVGISRRLSTRIKILAKLNIAERRLPQDGRMKLDIGNGQSIDMRISTLPTLWGEKVVLRLLDSGNIALDISELGFDVIQQKHYLRALDKPQGMILVTGPTGSGKTVSLYTGLKYLNTTERNISTAEDPVEINLQGINQVNINNDIGLDFSTALRSFLRQDPDVVMVGEIRDLETAEIGIKASQTGHLVLSTLHTNSAAEAITRLANMGVARYNLSASLSLIIAQRLARRLCNHCKQPQQTSDPTIEGLLRHYPSIDISKAQQANPDGCDHCNHGYLGRVGIYEVMPVSRELRIAIEEGEGALNLEDKACQQGMDSLIQSGITKVNLGVTSLSELMRVTQL
ncbi:type IV-A pilus assembly ATPase PilB [Veronia nyctiphanis]|uniref:Type IV-A pilus assembly ATPase PilB n=1 Tax=Veronia nyctiphanis TaxID=1278244 RepID=A0A4V1LSQ2_9GAMM|nr:type IV-A pilus assembly ATPase PilB [Veronia nyctiphanis]